MYQVIMAIIIVSVLLFFIYNSLPKKNKRQHIIKVSILTLIGLPVMVGMVFASGYYHELRGHDMNYLTKHKPKPNPKILQLEKKVYAITEEKKEAFTVKKELLQRIKKLQDKIDYEDKKTNTIISVINSNTNGRLSGHGESFYIAGQLYNVNPLLMTAICIHETGNGTSTLLKTHNNAAGMYNGKFLTYKSVEESIFDMGRRLKKYYIDMGLTDIESIGKKYCPIGADNDPTGLNKHWVPRVTKIYNKLYSQTGGLL